MHFRANRSACVNAFDMSAGKDRKDQLSMISRVYFIKIGK